MGLNGVPLLSPYANRLDEQALYANGQKFSFDAGLDNTGRGAIPIHGFLTDANAWKLVEAKADSSAAWVTTKLDFFRIPRYMKQFPFAHTLTMTYRVQNGGLEVHTRIDSDDPIRSPSAFIRTSGSGSGPSSSSRVRIMAADVARIPRRGRCRRLGTPWHLSQWPRSPTR
jgi:hypothetical protein